MLKADIITHGDSSRILLYNGNGDLVYDWAGGFNVFETKKAILREIENIIDEEINNMLVNYREIKENVHQNPDSIFYEGKAR